MIDGKNVKLKKNLPESDKYSINQILHEIPDIPEIKNLIDQISNTNLERFKNEISNSLNPTINSDPLKNIDAFLNRYYEDDKPESEEKDDDYESDNRRDLDVFNIRKKLDKDIHEKMQLNTIDIEQKNTKKENCQSPSKNKDTLPPVDVSKKIKDQLEKTIEKDEEERKEKKDLDDLKKKLDNIDKVNIEIKKNPEPAVDKKKEKNQKEPP